MKPTSKLIAPLAVALSLSISVVPTITSAHSSFAFTGGHSKVLKHHHHGSHKKVFKSYKHPKAHNRKHVVKKHHKHSDHKKLRKLKKLKTLKFLLN